MADGKVVIDQDYEGNKLINIGEISVSSAAIISPPSFSTTQNNYNPTDLQRSHVMRLTAGAASSITGIQAPDTALNKVLIIFNIGANNITLTDNSASSLAPNRFLMNGNTLLNPNEGIILLYDQLSQRWRAYGRSI